MKYVPRAACLTASVVCTLLGQFSTTARAASDITVAAIATGRLYVLGTTERPNTPVMLEGRFQAESDGKGLFQFETVYHPARCIVGVQIEGRTYEAVVSNCGQQRSPGEPTSAKRASTVEPIQVGPPGPQELTASPRAATLPPPTQAEKKLPAPAAHAEIKDPPAPPPRPKTLRKLQPL